MSSVPWPTELTADRLSMIFTSTRYDGAARLGSLHRLHIDAIADVLDRRVAPRTLPVFAGALHRQHIDAERVLDTSIERSSANTAAAAGQSLDRQRQLRGLRHRELRSCFFQTEHAGQDLSLCGKGGDELKARAFGSDALPVMTLMVAVKSPCRVCRRRYQSLVRSLFPPSSVTTPLGDLESFAGESELATDDLQRFPRCAASRSSRSRGTTRPTRTPIRASVHIDTHSARSRVMSRSICATARPVVRPLVVQTGGRLSHALRSHPG